MSTTTAIPVDVDFDTLRATRRRRHARNARIAIAILYISLFGFVAPDYYAMGGNPEDLVLNHYYRGFGFMVAGLILVVSTITNGISRHQMPLAFTILLVTLAYYAMTGAILYPLTPNAFGIILYRIAEWVLILILAHQASEAQRGGSEAEADELIKLAKLLIQLTFVIVVVNIIVNSGNVLGGSSERFQLGGAAIHPNRLGFIGALGILIFGLLSRSNKDRFLLLVSIIAVFAAGSRVGFLLAALSGTIVLGTRLPSKLRSVGTGLAVLASLAVVAYILLTPSAFRAFATLDQNILTLNNRTHVWQTSLQMLEESPVFGWGFILGPKQIGDFLRQNWWYATNAQGDVMGSLVAGGYIGLGLYLTFVACLLFYIARNRGQRRYILLGVTSLYLIASAFEPHFVHNVGTATVILVVLVRLADRWSRRVAPPSRPNSASPPPLPRIG